MTESEFTARGYALHLEKLEAEARKAKAEADYAEGVLGLFLSQVAKMRKGHGEAMS